MRISQFVYPVEVDIEITAEEMKVLLDLAKNHYDMTCRSATFVGGFLYGWYNQVSFKPEEPVPVRAKWRHCDTVAKILESPNAPPELVLKWQEICQALRQEHARVLKAMT